MDRAGDLISQDEREEVRVGIFAAAQGRPIRQVCEHRPELERRRVRAKRPG